MTEYDANGLPILRKGNQTQAVPEVALVVAIGCIAETMSSRVLTGQFAGFNLLIESFEFMLKVLNDRDLDAGANALLEQATQMALRAMEAVSQLTKAEVLENLQKGEQ